MKKRILVLAIAALTVMFTLAGCGGTVMSGNMAEDGKSYVITAEKAGKGDFMTSGTLIIEEGDTIMIDSELNEGGSIDISLIAAPAADDIEVVPEEAFDANSAMLIVNVTGTEHVEAGVPAGDYYVSVQVAKKATGTVTLEVVNGQSTGMANPWSEAASAAEAAEGAGIDGFDIPEGAEISLGTVTPETYRYMDGIAEVQFPIAAVEMTIRKGTAEAAEDGDISGDYNTYQYEWTQSIKGLEVTCFGNREGEATKTIWTSGDYCYAVLAYGAGGDDDFGLSADDLNSLINGIQ